MEKADILEMTVSYLQSRCLSKRNSRSPDLAEERLVNQLSTPYQPHSRPHHCIQTTGLSLLPGTTCNSTQPMNEDARHTMNFSDSTPTILMYATPTVIHSPSDSHYISDDSARSTPTSSCSTTSSPPFISIPSRSCPVHESSVTTAPSPQYRTILSQPAQSIQTSPSAWRPW